MHLEGLEERTDDVPTNFSETENLRDLPGWLPGLLRTVGRVTANLVFPRSRLSRRPGFFSPFLCLALDLRIQLYYSSDEARISK